MPIEKLRWIVLASLMAALTGVGAYIHIPIGPVPIVLSTLFVLLSGLLLGSRWGLASIALYLLVGAIGMPVFAGGKGGFAHFFGPTGGYLLGFALSAWVTGFISERSRGFLILKILAVVAGSLAIYGDLPPRLPDSRRQASSHRRKGGSGVLPSRQASSPPPVWLTPMPCSQ